MSERAERKFAGSLARSFGRPRCVTRVPNKLLSDFRSHSFHFDDAILLFACCCCLCPWCGCIWQWLWSKNYVKVDVWEATKYKRAKKHNKLWKMLLMLLRKHRYLSAHNRVKDEWTWKMTIQQNFGFFFPFSFSHSLFEFCVRPFVHMQRPYTQTHTRTYTSLIQTSPSSLYHYLYPFMFASTHICKTKRN